MSGTSVTWQIEHQCPQCGAPVSLEETDHLLTCSYCRTKLYIAARNEFHFCLPPRGAVTSDVLYAPYWRLKGISYAISSRGVDFRFIDTSTAAAGIKGLPPSLGARPQALKLKFAYAVSRGRFLRTHFPARELIHRLSTTSADQMLQIFLGETVSLIYTPLYVDGRTLCDAIVRKPVTPWEEMDDIDAFLEAGEDRPDWQIQFVGTICPNCGWNLEGEGDALILICRNCSSAWTCPRNTLEKVEFVLLPSNNDQPTYLPFWRMKARLDGIQLKTMADLIRLANLPRAVTKDSESAPLYFWCPAFKITPAVLLRWMRQMTSLQPALVEGSLLRRASLHPVNLGRGEAEESIPIALGSLFADKRKLRSIIPEIRITPVETLLVYHPFMSNRNDLIHETLNLAVERQALAYGRFL